MSFYANKALLVSKSILRFNSFLIKVKHVTLYLKMREQIVVENRNDLLKMSIGKLFIKLAVPGMIGMMAVGLYNIVDAIFIGQFIGASGVGAITIAYNIVLLNQAIIILFATGAMSLLSRSIGEKDEETIDKLFGNVLICVAVLSIVVTIVVCKYAVSIFQFLGARGEILDLGVKYIRIIALGFIAGNLGPALNILIRGEGKMKAAMIIICVSTLLNIILNPVFIKVFGWGIEGAAIATVISQLVYLIGDFIYFYSGRSVIKLSKKSFKLSFDIIPQILGIGFSGMLIEVMAVIQLAILLKTMSSYGGNDSIIIMGMIYRVSVFSFIPMWGIGQGLQPVLGANYGAKQFNRVKKAFFSFTKIATGIAGMLWLVFMLFPKFILSWFITDSALIEYGASNFRVYLCMFVLYGFMVTAISFFQALGKAAKAAVSALGKYLLFFIPIVLLLPISAGETGVWLAVPLADFLTIILAIIFMRSEFLALNIKINAYRTNN